MKTQRMDNSVAPVTGASEGGGKVVARQLTAAGVTVYVGSRDARRGQAAIARPHPTHHYTIREQTKREASDYRNRNTTANGERHDRVPSVPRRDRRHP